MNNENEACQEAEDECGALGNMVFLDEYVDLSLNNCFVDDGDDMTFDTVEVTSMDGGIRTIAGQESYMKSGAPVNINNDWKYMLVEMDLDKGTRTLEVNGVVTTEEMIVPDVDDYLDPEMMVVEQIRMLMDLQILAGIVLAAEDSLELELCEEIETVDGAENRMLHAAFIGA